MFYLSNVAYLACFPHRKPVTYVITLSNTILPFKYMLIWRGNALFGCRISFTHYVLLIVMTAIL